MATLDFEIEVLEILYEGIYEDHIKIQLTPIAEKGSQAAAKEVRIYRVPIGGILQSRRIARMKQRPAMSVPPYARDGDLPREFEETVKLQMEKLR